MDSFESYSENPRGLLRQGRWSFVAAVLVIGALGCTSLGSIEPLDVTLANLDITEVTVFETTLVAKIRITNPNPEALTIEGASFKLYLEDKKVATGTSKESFTVLHPGCFWNQEAQGQQDWHHRSH
jgi:LEA14-like dessication related protein